METEMLNPWIAYAILLAIGITGGLGDVWIFKWAKSGQTVWLVAACVVWLASLLLFGLLLKLDTRTFSAAFMLSTVFHVVLVIVCDLVFFGGRLTPTEWVGMALAAAAVVVLELGRPEAEPAAIPPAIAVARDGIDESAR
jgi:multidrug transporter EmrE-like cation transporter